MHFIWIGSGCQPSAQGLFEWVCSLCHSACDRFVALLMNMYLMVAVIRALFGWVAGSGGSAQLPRQHWQAKPWTEAEPDLLNCDYDLELRAVLLGRDPDLCYIERIRQAGQEHDILLQDFIKTLWAQASSSELEQRLASSQTDLLDARESAQLSLLQLRNPMQEEREHYLLVDGEKYRKLEAVVRELDCPVSTT
jgi:hypothetical protein